jgi:DNA-binding MarR family transcriptional regulator
LHVHTYICIVKLEDAIKTEKFTSQKQKVGLNILYTAWWLKTLISQELKEFGLTHEQYNVMRILKGKHPEKMCVRDIGSRMIERNSNVPRIIDRLVVKEFVERSTSDIDKRETVITLTTDGMTVLENSNHRINAVFKRAVSISEDGATTLNVLLDNLRIQE